jgi:hypothetical protein
MGIKYYLKAAVSEYTDKDGQAKKRYQTIGIVTETKKGDLMAKIEMLPLLGMKEGAFWCYLNVPEDKPEGKQFNQSLTNLDEDVPF